MSTETAPTAPKSSREQSTPPATTQPAEGWQSVQHWAQLAEQTQDGDDDDADSAFGDSESSSASIASSILRYRTIHGRTYHSERGNAQYWIPNDEQQNESMDINHHLLGLSLGGRLYLAPLEKEKVQKVLDVGTGTGIWAIDFADEFPGAEVTGTDISPIQPSWVPPNLKFEIEDFTQEWTFQPESFDYVHMRYLYGSVPDWTFVFKESFRACKPGGWVESYEASPRMESDDGTVTETSAMNEWGKFFIEGGKKMGRTFTPLDGDLQIKCMEEAGFVDIKTWDLKAPVGGWPEDAKLKEIGQFAQTALEQDYEGYVLFMANMMLGWTKEEVTVYCAQLRREIQSRKYHPFYRQRVVYGRRPGDSEVRNE